MPTKSWRGGGIYRPDVGRKWDVYPCTNTLYTHTNTLEHITGSRGGGCTVGYTNCRDYAARHQREPNSFVLLHISQVACSDQGEPLAFSFYRTDRLAYLEQLERKTSPQANRIPVDTPEMRCTGSALETPLKLLSPQVPQRDFCPDAACKLYLLYLTFFPPSLCFFVFFLMSLSKLYIPMCSCVEHSDMLFLWQYQGTFCVYVCFCISFAGLHSFYEHFFLFQKHWKTQEEFRHYLKEQCVRSRGI